MPILAKHNNGDTKMKITITDKELYDIRKLYNINGESAGLHIETNNEMRKKIETYACVSVGDVCLCIEHDGQISTFNSKL